MTAQAGLDSDGGPHRPPSICSVVPTQSLAKGTSSRAR
jgi:hypothetical protein